jgi:hypothetical protein
MRLPATIRPIGALISLIGIILLLPTKGLAGSCCGGSGGSALILPKTARSAAALTLAREQYDGSYDQQGNWHPDPPGANLAQYRASLALAQRLGPDWQGSLNLPYVWNRNRYAAAESTTKGLGDMNLALYYETFSSPTCVTRITRLKDLTPSIYLGGGLLLPTGVSPYDEVDNSFDITGRGFYRADLNLMLDKGVFPWNFTLTGALGHHFERKVNREYGRYVEPYKKRLGGTAGGSAAIGYTRDLPWHGLSLVTTVTYSYHREGEATIDGVKDESSGLRKQSIGLAAALLSFANDWSLSLGYVTSRPVNGWGSNCPATNVYTLGVSHVLY